MIPYIEKNGLYMARKPYGMPTTWGEQKCFLDMIEYVKPPFFADVEHRGKQAEYGLLNRLDNDTEGFVYFAKDSGSKDTYLDQQENGQAQKIYVCAVQGDMSRSIKTPTDYVKIENTLLDQTKVLSLLSDIKKIEYICEAIEGFHRDKALDVPIPTHSMITITYPIQHHLHLSDRMVISKDMISGHSVSIGRGQPQDAKTIFLPLYYDEEKNLSWVIAGITKGVRHQIRIHAASIGCPLVGDILYGKKQQGIRLHLWSVGML